MVHIVAYFLPWYTKYMHTLPQLFMTITNDIGIYICKTACIYTQYISIIYIMNVQEEDLFEYFPTKK